MRGPAGHGHIVEAHDRNLLGHLDAEVEGEAVDEADRHQVIGAEDRVDAGFARHQAAGRGPAVLVGEGISAIVFQHLQARRGAALAEATAAVDGGGGLRRAAHIGHALVPGAEQEVRQLAPAEAVVAGDGEGLGVGYVAVEEDQVRARPRTGDGALEADRRRHHHDEFGPVAQGLGQCLLRRAAGSDVVEHHAEAGVLQFLRQRHQGLGEEGVVEIGNEDRRDARALGVERAGKDIGAVAQRLGMGEDPLARAGRHIGPRVERPRDGRDGDAEIIRDLAGGQHGAQRLLLPAAHGEGPPQWLDSEFLASSIPADPPLSRPLSDIFLLPIATCVEAKSKARE